MNPLAKISGAFGGLLRRPAPASKPAVGEQTNAAQPAAGQSARAVSYGAWGGLAGPNGLGAMLGVAFPGLSLNLCGGWFGVGANDLIVLPRRGSHATYRRMSQDPTLRLVRSLITAPILASDWTIVRPDGRTDASDGLIRFLKDQVLPLRRGVVTESLRALEHGFRPFERVYEVVDGAPYGLGPRAYRLKKLKPLLPDFCQILGDEQGNFLGVSPGFGGAGGGPLAADKSWLFTYDGEAGNLYGWSRHEAAFDPWMDGNYARIRRAMLAGKLASNFPIVYYRPGLTKGADGTERDNYDVAKQVLASLFAGNGGVLPTTEYSDTDLQAHPELAALAPWKIDIIDCGTYAPAMAGMIAEDEYNDRRKVRAWGWPERAALEASHGGLGSGDAGHHGDAAEGDRELVDDEIAGQFSGGQPMYDVPGVLDEIVRINVGVDAVGSVVLRPMPLVDPKVQLYRDILKTVLANPKLAPTFAKVMDWEQILRDVDVATPERLQKGLNELIAAALDKAAAQDAADQQARTDAARRAGAGEGNKPKNVNGSGDGVPVKRGPARFEGNDGGAEN